MGIVITHEPAMTDVINAEIAKAVSAIQTAHQGKPGFRGYKGGKQKKKTLAIPYQISTWTEAVLLPKGTDTSNINRLSDIPKVNGKILSQELEARRITQTV